MGLELVPMCAPELASTVGGVDTLRGLPLRFGNGLLALEAAIAGQGILLGSRDLHQAELSTGKLVVAFDSPLNCDKAYYVVSLGPAIERSIAGLFKEWLLDEAGYAAA